MTVSYRIAARAVLLAIFVAASGASAQTGQDSASGSMFDALSDWLGNVGGYLGEKADRMLSPTIPRLGDVQASRLQGLVERSQEFHESYAVLPGCLVSVSNEFGEIRFETWENPRVQVHAEITAGAESGDVALQLAHDTGIEVLCTEGSVAIRTIKPDTRDLGKVGIDVNYVIKVPRDASALCENHFGDTVINGLGGSVTLKSEYGAVHLSNIGGPVEVYARGGGEFELWAHGLRQGGRFILERTKSFFVDVAGDLWIDNYGGSVNLREMTTESDLDIRSGSGPVDLFLGEDDEPDIDATVVFGSIESNIPLSRSSLGENHLNARSAKVESRQRVRANVSFADLRIIQDGERPGTSAETVQDDDVQYVTERVEPIEMDVPEDIEIVVDGIVGDILIEGIDEARLYVEAEKLVVLRSNATAHAALEALPFKVERIDGQVRIRTGADSTIGSLGCTRYKTDLFIKCPRVASLRVTAANGHTTVRGTGGAVSVTQKAGRISVEHAKGPLALLNEKGDILATNCAGPVELSLDGGEAKTTSIFGKQTLYCVNGKVVIDEPGGDVTVRSHGGDARIMALQGVAGDYDIKVEEGNLSILLSQSADNVELSVKATNGNVKKSAVRLFNGVMEKGARTYSGGKAGGAHAVKLETKNGNIVID